MIDAKCWFCKKELDEWNALLFAPPSHFYEPVVTAKFHLCRACYWKIMKFMGREQEKQMRKKK